MGFIGYSEDSKKERPPQRGSLFGDGNYNKFNEANELIALGAAFPVKTGKKIVETLEEIAGEGDSISEKISEYFTSKRGATERIINYTGKLLHQ